MTNSKKKGKKPDKILSTNIEEYFTSEGDKLSKYHELFKGNDDFIDQMTELDHNEIRACMTLLENDAFLKTVGIRPVYGSLIHIFMRLQVSKDRKSRGEYVDVHRGDEERREKEGKPIQTTPGRVI